jgi:hypothetical protein
MHDMPLIQTLQASASTIRNTTEELCNIPTQNTASNKATQLHSAPSDSGEASFDVAIQDAREGTKGGRKRCQQDLQEAAILVDGDSGNGMQAGSSGMVCITVVEGIGKPQVRLPTDHFEKLLEETCLSHTYPIKHKLRDCGMMKNFMASGSLTRGMEVAEVPNEGDTMPFPREDAVTMI